MNIESIIGITSGLAGIGTTVVILYNKLKKRPLTELMNELADRNTSVKRQHKILSIINVKLAMFGRHISAAYIKGFHSNGRSKLAIFYDICNENNIEPTPEICKLLLGYDEAKFRNEWVALHIKTDKPVAESPNLDLPDSTGSRTDGGVVVYLSALLASRYPACCERLTQILNRHGVPFMFLEGTKDVWCRDYMPVQTPSGKLVQFRYEPSYLQDAKYADLRTDVRHVDEVNGIKPRFSDINLDGGNVVMYGSKAIITDRVFSENPDREPAALRAELARLLECEIIIVPAYKPEYDFTGHADGMMRFIDADAVIVNDLEQDFKYMREKIVKALDVAGLRYINFPWFEYKIKGNAEHAIGVYLNYLEVGNLIVMPKFGVPGNKDAEALAKLKELFPDKIIEAIDYNDVALNGGVLNCTTWVVKVAK